MMMTLSNTGEPGTRPAWTAAGSSADLSGGVWSDDSRCASHAMVLDLPDPAEAMTR